jgi:hypothetical protein
VSFLAQQHLLYASGLLTIEVEKHPDGRHSFVIALGDDAVLYVSDSFADISDAVKAAQTWIEHNG